MIVALSRLGDEHGSTILRRDLEKVGWRDGRVDSGAAHAAGGDVVPCR